jgi:uncharacterized protein YqgC (DUF456 family)
MSINGQELPVELWSMALWALAGVLTLVGVAGLVAPILPGPVLLFAGLLCAAGAEGFREVGVLTLAVLALLMTLAVVMDFVASALGVKHFGASNRAAWGAIGGGLLGLFWGLPGILLGPFIGAFFVELSIHNRLDRAGRAGFGAWLGFLVGTAAKVALGFAMIGIFLAARWL